MLRYSILVLVTVGMMAACRPITRPPEPADMPGPVVTLPESATAPAAPAEFVQPIAYTQFGPGSVQIAAAFISLPTVQAESRYLLTDANVPAYQPIFSPDARYIAYLVPDSENTVQVWVIDIPNDAEVRQVTSESLQLLRPLCWSEDSRYLVFAGPQPDRAEMDVYRLDAESGWIDNLTYDSPVWDARPACSPTDDRIAFASDRYGDGKRSDNIWLMNLDGDDLVKLTETSETLWENIAPAWSPDGEQIAFYRWGIFEDETGGPAGLWVIDIDGGAERLLVPLEGMLTILEAPVWSPDGRWIAYQGSGDEGIDVYIVSSAGGETVNVSEVPGGESGISWTADSQFLTFTNSTETDIQLYIVRQDGSELHPLFEEGGTGFGSWSPLPNR